MHEETGITGQYLFVAVRNNYAAARLQGLERDLDLSDTQCKEPPIIKTHNVLGYADKFGCEQIKSVSPFSSSHMSVASRPSTGYSPTRYVAFGPSAD